MDISSIGTASTDLSQASTGNAVALTVLKKALDIEAQGALQLLQALPKSSPSNPPHLGNNIDTLA